VGRRGEQGEALTGDRLVLPGHGDPTLVVAEVGANHDGDVERAHALIDAFAAAGAKALKFQTYTAAELVADPERPLKWDSAGDVREEPIGELFDRLSLPRDAMPELFAHARELGVAAFSTPFSPSAAEQIAAAGAAALKVSSADISYTDLLVACANTGLPVIASTGKATVGEVDQAVAELEGAGAATIALLHCVATYPAPPDELNLRAIETLRLSYPACVVGFSDHSLGTACTLAAVAGGARIIEKHVTYDSRAEGPDHAFSLEPEAFGQLVRDVETVDAALGTTRRGVRPSEEHERHVSTRSLVAGRDLPAGSAIDPDALVVLRPGWGIHPHDRDKVAGLAPPRDIPAGTVLTWDLLKPGQS
jgi:sialic acid synthase SpsE